MKEQTREDPKILAAAERQMKAYSKSEEIADWIVHELQPERFQRKVGPYITISREAGAGGSKIAQLIGDKLGWEVLDKQLVERVAERYHLSRPMLELVDETIGNWAYDILGTLLDPHVISHEKYVVHLTRVLLGAARRGKVVIVGRGANILLPREGGMAVRIVASEKYRLAETMQQHGFDEAKARKFMAESDSGRREFVRRYFHHDVNDPHLFDLTVNVDRIGPEGAAEVIVATHRHWHPHTDEAA